MRVLQFNHSFRMSEFFKKNISCLREKIHVGEDDRCRGPLDRLQGITLL
jgi:hypothetical protein